MPGFSFQSLFNEDPERQLVSGPGATSEWRIKPRSLMDEDADPRFPAFQQAWKQGAGVGDLFGPEPFKLQGTVSPSGGDNTRADVAKVQTLLGKAGYLDLGQDGPSGYANPNTDKAIRDFQQDNGLQVDGVLKPGGPTIAKLGGLLGGRAEANSFVSELPPVGENPDSRYRQTPPTFPGFRPQLNGTRKPADLLSILLGEAPEPTIWSPQSTPPRNNPWEMKPRDISISDDPRNGGITGTLPQSKGTDIPSTATNTPFGSADGADHWAAGNMAQALLGRSDYADAVTHFRSEIGRNRAEAMPYLASLHQTMNEKNPELAAKFAGEMQKAGLAQEAEGKTTAQPNQILPKPKATPAVNPSSAVSSPTEGNANSPTQTPSPAPVLGKQAPGRETPRPQQPQATPEPQSQPSPPSATTTTRDYGTIADQFGLDHDVGAKAGDKTKAALDALQKFRDSPDRSPAALNQVMAAAHQAAAENPKAAEKIRGMLLDYKTNSLWQPGLMSEQELKNAGGDNPSARFSNLAGVAGGVTAAGGSALEVAGHAGSGKALGILGRGVGMPMAIASGIDQAQREGLKGEIKRRGMSETSDIPNQLGLNVKGNMSGAEGALSSMIAIRDADDKAAAVAHAQGKITELKRQNPEAGQILEKQLGSYIANPASVPALLRQDEIDAFLKRGSDLGNYLNMGSAGLDTAALLTGGPLLGLAAPVLAMSTGFASWQHEGARQKAEAELQRRRGLSGGNDKGVGR